MRYYVKLPADLSADHLAELAGAGFLDRGVSHTATGWVAKEPLTKSKSARLFLVEGDDVADVERRAAGALGLAEPPDAFEVIEAV